MAATGFTPVSLYYSATASNVPLAANLVAGELALNTNDGRLFYKDSSGVVQTMASKGTGSIGGSTTQVQFNNAGVLGGSASLTWSGTVLTSSGFAGPLNGTVGATTPSTGAFTTLSATGNVAFAGGSIPVASGYQYGVGVGPNGLVGTRSVANDYRLELTNNSKLDGTYTSTTTQPVSVFAMDNGSTSITSYPSGTAGNALGAATASMTLGTTGLAVTGTLSSSLDATIYGLTVGRGAGAVSTNTAVGGVALGANTSGFSNSAFGYAALYANTTGANNVAVGQAALQSNTTASYNTAIA